MEILTGILGVVIGLPLLILVIGWPIFSIGMALTAYMRYHFFGVHSPIIDDLFYRKSRGESKPAPSMLKGLAPLVLVALVLLFCFL